jgi:hypothetical protein
MQITFKSRPLALAVHGALSLMAVQAPVQGQTLDVNNAAGDRHMSAQ